MPDMEYPNSVRRKDSIEQDVRKTKERNDPDAFAAQNRPRTFGAPGDTVDHRLEPRLKSQRDPFVSYGPIVVSDFRDIRDGALRILYDHLSAELGECRPHIRFRGNSTLIGVINSGKFIGTRAKGRSRTLRFKRQAQLCQFVLYFFGPGLDAPNQFLEFLVHASPLDARL
jgi:hypothetical protein